LDGCWGLHAAILAQLVCSCNTPASGVSP
jgi:hypothetical protein